MVKYADGPTTEIAVEVNASPATVWALISNINTPAEFSGEFQRAEWLDPEPAVGSTFRGYNKHPRVGEWNVVCTVTAYEPEQTFEWTVGDVNDKSARWRFDLAPSGPGSTLRFSAEMGPGRSGLSAAIDKMPDREEDIVANRLQEWSDNMTATLNGIKAKAENS